MRLLQTRPPLNKKKKDEVLPLIVRHSANRMFTPLLHACLS